MLSLTQIADKHRTDKGSLGPRRDRPANYYTDVYSAYLERLRDKPIDFLEIGLGITGAAWKADLVTDLNPQGGASIRTWYEYFPRARIFGVDINEARELDNDRVRTFVADQGAPEQLEAFVAAAGVKQFDVIIDDGSHRPDHQQVTLAVLFKYLRPGGLYFIEDLANNGAGDSGEGRTASGAAVNTRRLLRHFKDTGEFLAPNTLLDPQWLAREIEFVAFHCIRPSFRFAFGGLSRPLRRIPVYREARERVAVLGKR